MNNHYWVKEMEEWFNNMTPKEKLEFDKGVEEMKTEMFVNVVKKVVEKKSKPDKKTTWKKEKVKELKPEPVEETTPRKIRRGGIGPGKT